MTTLKTGLAAPCYSALGCLLTVLSLPLLALDTDTQKNIDTLHNYYDVVQQRLHGSATTERRATAASPARTPSAPAAQYPDNNPPEHNRQALPAASQQRSVAYGLAGRDPFAITPVMTENRQNASGQGVGFVPLSGNVRIPNMRLKGIITGSGQQPLTALLEIDGLGVFVVREGDTVGLQGVGNTGDVILVESISRLSLVVRTGSYGGVSDKRYVIR